jgi:Na+/melibiose symporter-like transporter
VASNLARLGGPALGGVIAVAYGLSGVVLADVGSFLLAALLFTLIRVPGRAAADGGVVVEAPTPVTGAHPLWQALAQAASDWRDGLRIILRERTLTLIFVVFSVTSIGEGIFATLLVVFITANAHGDARAFGGMMSAQAVGGLLGGALMAVAGKRLLTRWAIGASALLFGAFDLAIFNAPTYFPALASQFAGVAWLASVSLIVWLLALFAVVGVPGVPMSSGLQTILQMQTPEGYLGRVFASLGACSALFLAIGTGLAAWLAPRFGTIAVLNAQGAGYIIIGLLLMALLTHTATATPAPRDATPVEAAAAN